MLKTEQPDGVQGLEVNKHLVTLLKYLLGLGLLAWVIWANWEPASGQGLRHVFEKQLNVVPLVLALVVCLLSVVMTFLRWYVLVRAQDLPFTLPNALRLGMVGYFFSTFLPGSVGGDIIKAACIAREQSRRTVAVATVLLDRAIGLWGLLWLVALLGGAFLATGQLGALVTEPDAAAALRAIAVGAGVLAVTSLALWLLPKLGGPLAEFWRAVWMYRCRSRSVALAVGMSMVGHVGFVLTYYFASQIVAPPSQAVPSLGAQAQFLIVPVGMAIKAGFPSPGGIGGGEAGLGWLYTLAGGAFADGVFAALMERAVNWVLALAGYLVYLRMKPALAAARAGPPPKLAAADVGG
jgi:uncharacterized membrane protein YbhN (UPF0104 family)